MTPAKTRSDALRHHFPWVVRLQTSDYEPVSLASMPCPAETAAQLSLGMVHLGNCCVVAPRRPLTYRLLY